jgi:photosystem II stability/assembly factor-like uncharacterized protein
VKKKRAILFAALLALAAPLDSGWRIVGPGGGGSMFHPTISPHDPRTVVLACDMTGNYITHDGGATWRIFNLRDPVRFFLFDPIDPNVIYAKAGILYRSPDKGATWKTLLPRPSTIEKITVGDDHASENYHLREEPRGEINAMALDPEDSRSLYLGIDNGFWSSTDTGVTWRKTAELAGKLSVIWIDPQSARNDRTIYAAGPDAIYTRRGGQWSGGESPGPLTSVSARLPVFYATSNGKVFVSEGGVKWRAAADLGSGLRATVIAADPHQSNTAYVSHDGRSEGIAKTSDGGRHWEPLPYGGRDAWLSDRFGAGWAGNPYGLAVAPGDSRIVYATDSGRVMHSGDGGKTWVQAYSRRTPDGNWTTNGIDVTTDYGVHFDPFDPRHVFISYTDIGLWASENGGESWYSATRNGVPKEWVNTTYWMEFDPAVRGRMWAVMSGVHDLPRDKMWRRASPDQFNGGVVRSDDGGRTWRVQNNGMPQTAATHILRDRTGALYVTGFGHGVFKSTDGGEHWSLRNAGIEGNQPFAWRLAQDGKGAIYLVVARRSAQEPGVVYRSADGAEHWTRVPLPDRLTGPNGIAIDPRDPARLYLAAWGRSTPEGAFDGGIWLSTNAGAAWRNVLRKDQHIYDVTIDPRKPGILYASGFEANVWRSADRGLTWNRVPGFDFKWGHRVIPDPVDPSKIWVTTFGGSVWVGPAAP